MEKLKMESVSIAEDSLNKIAELFPNVVTESMGKDGQLHKAIDFDKLKFLLIANQAAHAAGGKHDRINFFSWHFNGSSSLSAYYFFHLTTNPRAWK